MTEAENVEDLRMNQESFPGMTPVKSNSGEESDCATVALVAETQLGADRDALWLTVISSVSAPRFLEDPQPAGRTGGEAESKFSAYGYTVTCPTSGRAWPVACGATAGDASLTNTSMPERGGRTRCLRKREITPGERCLTFQAIITIYCVSNNTRDHGPITNSHCR
jgi:hypothetical protein